VAQSLLEFAADKTNRKPLAVVIRSRGSDSHIGKEVIEFRNKLLSSRIPVYRNLNRAAQALAKFMKYHHLLVNI
jgi:succinyl-CoA synthetase beta subunit